MMLGDVNNTIYNLEKEEQLIMLNARVGSWMEERREE